MGLAGWAIGRGANLHLHLNYSNLAAPFLQLSGQIWRYLTQLGGDCAVIGGQRHGFLVEAQYAATSLQRGRDNEFELPLQGRQLLGFSGELTQFATGG